jgi:hypothetical protein
MSSRTFLRGAVITVAAALAAAVTGSAAYAIADYAAGVTTRTQHYSYAATNTVNVAVNSGDVDIIGDSVSDITVDIRITESFRKAHSSASVDGDTLRLSGGCPIFAGGRCAVSFTVRVPVGTTVDAHSDSGHLAAAGLSGAVTLSTDSGSVTAQGTTGALHLSTHSGDVRALQVSGGPIQLSAQSGDVRAIDLVTESTATLQTSSGDVTAVDARAGQLVGKTSSGDVRLILATPSDTVTASTHSGDVTVLLPAGGYQVETHTDSGDQHVGVSRDSSSPHRITASTNSGDVRVEYGS